MFWPELSEEVCRHFSSSLSWKTLTILKAVSVWVYPHSVSYFIWVSSTIRCDYWYIPSLWLKLLKLNYYTHRYILDKGPLGWWNDHCSPHWVYVPWLTRLQALLSDQSLVTMQLRIYAMYGKSRKILVLLSVTFLSVFITAFTIIVNIMKHETGS